MSIDDQTKIAVIYNLTKSSALFSFLDVVPIYAKCEKIPSSSFCRCTKLPSNSSDQLHLDQNLENMTY